MENQLMNIAERYHKNCDAFDNIYCSAVSKHGESMPRTDSERKFMNQNASSELRIAREEGVRLGFTNKDVERAISDYARHFSNK